MPKGIRDGGGVKERRRRAPCGEEGNRADHARGAGTWFPQGPLSKTSTETDLGQAHSGAPAAEWPNVPECTPTETQTAPMEHLPGTGHLTLFIPLR